MNSKSELIVHKRASWKDVYPGFWDISFGGVCDVGEPWLDAAKRELFEEAGIVAGVLEELGSVAYDDVDGQVLGRAYRVQTDDPIVCEDGEVVAIDRVPIAELERWADGRDICRDSKLLLFPLLLNS